MAMTIEIDEVEMGVYESVDSAETSLLCTHWADRAEKLAAADVWLASLGLVRGGDYSLYRGLGGLTLSAEVTRV